ncbi:MAG: hypothetical protein K0S53_604 [Bacteroidetes bacterium]|jgi:hypothetical protein|nr:hypothetical protein [Bacteroidota bacterium]MDF2453915.1 hypothetical protein [Bacteroidota bacterium]
MKHLIIIVLILSCKLSLACQCPITSLTDKETNKYDIIFKGKIKSVKLNNTNSEAVFTIDELYKGLLAQDFKVLFNDADVCKIEMRAGDEWIIYANYHQIDNAKMDFCSRSRKFFKNNKEDFFAETTGISYEEELRYLQSNLGLHKLMKENPNRVENRNILPTGNQSIVIIICSILGLIFFYVLINKIFKKIS